MTVPPKTFELSENCDSQFRYIAFYADCEHQLHPITSGVRLALVFNLVSLHSDDAAPISHAINVGSEAKLRSIVTAWRGQAKPLKRFGYQLGHQYTPITFSDAALKGRDGIVYQTLVNAKSSDGSPLFEVALVLMERYIYEEGETGKTVIDKTTARKVISAIGATLEKVGRVQATCCWLDGFQGRP
jgi:hypothetical protein